MATQYGYATPSTGGKGISPDKMSAGRRGKAKKAFREMKDIPGATVGDVMRALGMNRGSNCTPPKKKRKKRR